jgi:hypothetical protein
MHAMAGWTQVESLEDEGGIVKTVVFVTLIYLVLCSSIVSAVELNSLSLGFHLIPSVEKQGGVRSLDMTLSFGATLQLDPDDSIDLMAMIDSGPSSLGTSAQFNHTVTTPLKAGLGVTVLWTLSEDAKLQWPIVGTYAHAAARTYFYPEFWGESAISFPLVTLANPQGEWTLLPLSELPTLSISADATVVDHASIQARVTFQPVITDTTLLQDPIGRITDDLLILPMGSIFLRYVH